MLAVRLSSGKSRDTDTDTCVSVSLRAFMYVIQSSVLDMSYMLVRALIDLTHFVLVV